MPFKRPLLPSTIWDSPLHEQVAMWAPWGEEIPIDVDIAPVVAELWDRGWWTHSSCCGLGGVSGVVFTDKADFLAFLEIAGRLVIRTYHGHRWDVWRADWDPADTDEITARLAAERSPG